MGSRSVSKTYDLSIIAVFVVIAVVLGYTFITVPNVELITATIFLSGYLLGSRKGIIVGVVAEFIYSMFNPYGIALPPLLIAQIIAMGFVGYCGGLLYLTTSKSNNHKLTLIQFGAAGFLLTLIYQILVAIGSVIIIADSTEKLSVSFISFIIAGLLFSFLQIISNTLIFLIVLPLTIRGLVRIEYFKSRLILSFIILVCLIPNKLGFAEVRNFTHDQQPDSSKVIQPDSIKVDTTKAVAKITILENDTSKSRLLVSNIWKFHKQEMQTVIYKDLGDVLSYLPGFFTKNLHFPGQKSVVIKHGLPSNYLMILVDGRPMKDPHTNILDLNLIPVESMKELSVENELFSPIFTDVVNISIDRYSDNLPYSRVYFHKGPSDFSDVDVTFGQNVSKKMDALVGFTLKGFSGPLKPQSYEHHIARAKLHYDYSPRWRFFYSWLYNRIKFHEIGPLISAKQYATPNARSLQLRHDHTITIKGNILNSDYQNLLINIYFSSIDKKFKDQSYPIFSKNNFNYTGFFSELDHQLATHYLKAAVLVEHDWTNGDDVGKKHQSSFLIGINDAWFLSDKNGFQGKIDFYSQTDQGINLNGGVGAFFKFTQYLKSTVGISHTVRLPTLTELYAKQYIQGNSALQPEKIESANLGFQLQSVNHLSLNINFYLNHINDLIDYQIISDSLIQFENHDDQNRYGIDVQFQWLFWKKFEIGTNIGLVNDKNNQLYYQPKKMIYGYIQYRDHFFQNDLKVNIKFESRFWGSRWSNLLHPYKFFPDFVKLPQDVIINLFGFFEIMGNLKAYWGIENILNREYQLVYGYPMNGRTIHYGLRWEFRE